MTRRQWRHWRNSRTLAGATALAALPVLALADAATPHRRGHSSFPKRHSGIEFCDGLHVGRQKRRGREKGDNEEADTDLPLCRGGDMGVSSTENDGHFRRDNLSEDLNANGHSEIASAHLKTKMKDHAVIDASRRRTTRVHLRESPVKEESQPQIIQRIPPRPRLVIEFDMRTGGGGVEQGSSLRLRSRIQNRRGGDEDRNRRSPNGGPAVSISLAVSPPPTTPLGLNTDEHGVLTPAQHHPPKHIGTIPNNESRTLLDHLRGSTRTALALLSDSAALLPALLLSRRALNSTSRAIVDYIRGRTIRKRFTRLERAYLRYSELPAVTRSGARLASQLGILLGLSWAVRVWMVLALIGNDGLRRLVAGAPGGSGGGGGGSGALLGTDWTVGSPGASLCGLVWIGTVVGIGHVLVIALSVWGGPLRLQATQQQTDKERHVLQRIVPHPLLWIRDLDEWQHLPSFRRRSRRRRGARRDGRGRSGGDRGGVHPDPLSFPATWLPLRWLQMAAVARAFATAPAAYRWSAPEDARVAIPRLMKQYLVQLALGDEWRRVFLIERRVGLGIVVVAGYFVALVSMVFTAFTLNGGAAAMLLPSILAAIISAFMNIVIFWNRLGTKEQAEWSESLGLA